MYPSRFIQHKLIFHNNIINKVFNYLSLLLEETEVIVSSTKLEFIIQYTIKYCYIFVINLEYRIREIINF